MSTESEQPDLLATDDTSSAAWYHAAMLHERLAGWSDTMAASLLDAPDRQAEAARIVQRWKAQAPFEQGTLFARRLAMDHLSERDLLALLAEPVEALAKRLGPQDWVSELTAALWHPAALPVPEQDQERLRQQFALVQPFYSILRPSIAAFQEGISVLVQHSAALPRDPDRLLSLFLPGLLRSIEQRVSKTMVLELHVARLRGLLDKETPRERFQQYLLRLSEPAHLLAFMQEYSVLARQMLLCSQLWAACSLELLQHLCADWQEICATCCPCEDAGQLSEVRIGAGDTHRGGHSVTLLTFSSGWRVVYKARSLRIDLHFQELLTWLNARGAHPAFRPIAILERGTYGWCEYVSAGECSTPAEVARFYERQGGYLALFYLLEATDSHYENVIAAGEDPVFVDLEALFQHRQRSPTADLSPGQQALEHSVMRSFLLPLPTLFNQQGEGIEISGLSQTAGQRTPRALPQWEDAGTDDMKLVRRRLTLQESANCPRLHNHDIRPLDYIEQIVSGFTTLYRSLSALRTEIEENWLPRFANDEVRFVARATSMYATLLAESFHPNMLRHGLKRERFLDRLWSAVTYWPDLARLIAAEQADLQRGDIPLFTTRPASKALWTDTGVCLPDFFAHSSLDLVRQRLQALNEQDLVRQIWIIRACFASSAAQRGIATPADSGGHVRRQAGPGGREILLAQACAIGDRLDALALRAGPQADWLGLTRLSERNWQIAAAGLDLQSGLPGPILFLASLGRVSGNARYTELARAGLCTLRSLLHRRAATQTREGIGAFSGASSCLYLFTQLAVLWHDQTFLQEAETLALSLAGQIGHDASFAIMDGAAGYLALLLNLYALGHSQDILQLARVCGEHLLAHAQAKAEGVGWQRQGQDIPCAGFSHGAAGIAWSLFKLAAASGEERFRRVAEAALQHDGHPHASSHAGMSWLHGAPSCALGQLLCLPYLQQSSVQAGLEHALATTIAEGCGYAHAEVGPNHCLAHGDCGNLETLLLAAEAMPGRFREDLQRLTARVVEDMRCRGWVTGVPLHQDTPGLLFGLAGIGYQCLRLAEPAKVPSVLSLALAPPA